MFILRQLELCRQAPRFMRRGRFDPNPPQRIKAMSISGESLVIILLVGLAAGWLAGQIVQGSGFGLVGDLIIGIVGAFVGSWLFPQLGVHFGADILSAIINATLGAVVLLLVIRLVRGGRDWRGNWGRGL
jgi:uncharacterized membrane protein YeaQ/YmgE (transglycosylase-associated protein family)